MIFDIFLFGIAFYLIIPGVAGYGARSYGHSFWKWFLLATFFPIITHFALYWVVKNDLKRKKLISLLKAEEITYMEEQIAAVKSEKNIPSPPKRSQDNNKLIKE